MSNKELCADYFKTQPAFSRCFSLMKKKWESYGRLTGKIVLKNCTDAERSALTKVFGKEFKDKNVSFSMTGFQEALQNTRFAPITLKELLEAYYGGSLSTNQEKKNERERSKQEFFAECKSGFQEQSKTVAWNWIRQMEEEQKYGYRILMREFDKDREKAKELICSTSRALCILEELGGEKIYLAVLATQVSGNPHYFDRGEVAGTLLVHALCWDMKQDYPENARGLNAMYLKKGIWLDDISSTVTAFGLHLETENGLHPAYEGFLNEKESCVITMENLVRVKRAFGQGKEIFIVENEMVFCHLLDKTRELPVTLLCTSGQLRTAAFVLIDMLIESGAKVYYSGDLDPEGMDIADRLWQNYKENVILWRMSVEDYYCCISNKAIDARSIVKLKNLKNYELLETASKVKHEGKAGYQEALLEFLEKDIVKQVQEKNK